VLTSASASTQTTILPAARTALSMAAAGALPPRFGEIHPTYLNPGFSTLVMGVVSTIWYVGLSLISKNVMDDSVLALGVLISFYYALTAFACVILHRKELTQSAFDFVSYGVLPALGGLVMLALFVASLLSLSTAGSTKIAGIGSPLAIGIGALAVGGLLLLAVRRTQPTFFERR
jgi:amino acid transporter